MITLKLNIKHLSDTDFVFNKQLQYSYAFRKIYKNLDKIKDLDYLKYLKNKFNLNDIELRSVISEVQTKFNQTQTNKIQCEEKILEISEEIKKLKESKSNIRKIFKLNHKLEKTNNSLSKDITFGGKINLKKISFLNNNIKDNLELINDIKYKYQQNRILPISLLGEANQVGNRFFKFDLTNNKIFYKPKRGVKIEIIFTCYNSHKKTFIKLQELIDKKEIAITVNLSTNYICLSYDDEKFNGFDVDIKQRTSEVKKINSQHIDKQTKTDLIKAIYCKYYQQQRDRKLLNKLDYRYLSIDTNPDYIGCSIIDKVGDKPDGIKIIKCFNYDLTILNKPIDKTIKKYNTNEYRKHINNKRKHGICHIWKDIFMMCKYYNCAYIVLEDLNVKPKDMGNKTSNRKVNNVWYRELSTKLIDKYINKLGLIKIEINPCYTSFIGNIKYYYIDPINASIEIGRRGIYKYIKYKFYPVLTTGTIENAMSKLLKLNSLNDINSNELRDVSFIKDCGNWVDMYRKVRESGLRYRATIDDSYCDYQVVNNINHSKVEKLLFSNENVLTLHNKQ